jgi:hypothetical protein
MARVTIGKKNILGGTLPLHAATPIINTRPTWGEDWLYEPDIEFESCALQTGHAGFSSLSMRRHYGAKVRGLADAGPIAKRPLDLMDHWVRLRIPAGRNTLTQFVGKITAQHREPLGNEDGPTGVQHWTAHGPAQILHKRAVYRSRWLVSEQIASGGETELFSRDIGWLPAMNVVDSRGLLVGNRSDRMINAITGEIGGAGVSLADGSFVFGGRDLWSHYDHLIYLLAWFVDEDAQDGPRWSLGGETGLLTRMRGAIEWRDHETALSMIQRLIPREAGLDFVIRDTSDGFELFVFVLNGQEVTHNGATLPRNTNTFSVNPASMPENSEVEIVETQDQQYDRITIIGGRIVVCCSLDAAADELIGRWPAALEFRYKAAAAPVIGEDADKAADEARRADVFDPVYQHFGVPSWFLFVALHARPIFDDNGAIIGLGADHQTLHRDMLDWIPVQATDVAIEDHEAPFVHPRVYLFHESTQRWHAGHKHGIACRAGETFFGVELSHDPNHLLALRHWGDQVSAWQDVDGLGVPPPDYNRLTKRRAIPYDWQKMVATMAFQSDQRLRVHYELTSGGLARGDELVIHDPTAEVWYIAAGTVIGVEADGTLKRTGAAQVVRNDAERMAMTMAGAIARYWHQRTRAKVTMNGIYPVSNLLGRVLDVVEQSGDTQFVQSPVTAIEMTNALRTDQRPTTILRTGYT